MFDACAMAGIILCFCTHQVLTNPINRIRVIIAARAAGKVKSANHIVRHSSFERVKMLKYIYDAIMSAACY